MLLMNRINKLKKRFEDKGLLNATDTSKIIIQAQDGIFMFDNCFVPMDIDNFKEEYKKNYKRIKSITEDMEKYAVYDCTHCKAENVYIDGSNDNKYPAAVFAGIIPDNFNYDIWEGFR